MDKREVCNGCWRVGLCKDEFVTSPTECKCPCMREGWKHTDDRDNRELVILDPALSY